MAWSSLWNIFQESIMCQLGKHHWPQSLWSVLEFRFSQIIAKKIWGEWLEKDGWHDVMRGEIKKINKIYLYGTIRD